MQQCYASFFIERLQQSTRELCRKFFWFLYTTESSSALQLQDHWRCLLWGTEARPLNIYEAVFLLGMKKWLISGLQSVFFQKRKDYSATSASVMD